MATQVNQLSFPRRRLAVRMLTVILAWTLLASLCVSGFQVYVTYQQAADTIENRINDIEKSMLPSLTEALWTMDEERILIQLNGLITVADVGKVELTDEQGQRYQRYHPDFKHSLSEKEFRLVHIDAGKEHTVGTLLLVMDGRGLHQRLIDVGWSIGFTTLAIMVIGAILILLLFHYWVGCHLQQVASYAQGLDISSLDQKLLLNGKRNSTPDELDLVVAAINLMRERLKLELQQRLKAEMDLLNHKEQLEQLVIDRTLLLEQKTKQLQHQSKELEEQNAELDAYAHTVAHDLKHPLTTLIGFSTLLSQSEISLHLEQQQSYIKMMKQSALKMNDIINGLLQLASIRHEEDVVPEYVDMDLCVKEAIHRLNSFADQYQGRFEVVTELPAAMGHYQWLEEVWVNYLSNAIKYGGPNPLVRIGADVTGSNRVCYWVSDPGPGVNIEKRHELFLAFSRLGSSLKDSNGLGLSIVKRIIDKLHGEVGYKFDEASGSTFWFSVDIAKRKME